MLIVEEIEKGALSKKGTENADKSETNSENGTVSADNKDADGKNSIGNDEEGENKDEKQLHWGYYVSFGLIVLIVIAILIFAVIANFSSHNFAVETVNRIKESGNIQDSQQNYDTLMSIFQNQYSSFVSSLTVILTIFTIVISVLATIIPVISTKEKIRDIEKQQLKINKEHEKQLNELKKLRDEYELAKLRYAAEYDKERKKIIHSGLLTRRSMLAYEALGKNDIINFDFHFNSARAAEPEDPLVDQYQADNYYERIKYDKEHANEYIHEAIKLYNKAIEKHKELIRKAEEAFEKNNGAVKKGTEKSSAIKEHRLMEIDYSEKEEFKEAYRNCANLYMKINNTQDAIKKLKEVLDINMYDFEARNNLGSIYCNMGDLEQAVELFEENKKNMPSDYDDSYTNSLLVATYWKKLSIEGAIRNKIKILSEIIAIFGKEENKNKSKENKTARIIKDLFYQAMTNDIDKSDSEMAEKDKNAFETMLKTISQERTIELTKEALSNIEYPIKLDFAEKYIKKQED